MHSFLYSILPSLKSRLVNSLHVFAKIININYEKPGTLAAILSLQNFSPIGLQICFTLFHCMIFLFLFFNILFHIELYRLSHGCVNHDSEGKRFKSPIHCCDVTKPPYLFSGELSTSTLHCELLFVYIVCCRGTGQCFYVLRRRKPDVILT